MKLTFNRSFFYVFLTLFALEVIIALFIRDSWIRPFVGDVLVVWLIYSFLKIFISNSSTLLAIGVMIFAILIELGQYFQLVSYLGLEHYTFAKIIIGSTFDWWDIIAYLIGTLIILRLKFFEKKYLNSSEKSSQL